MCDSDEFIFFWQYAYILYRVVVVKEDVHRAGVTRGHWGIRVGWRPPKGSSQKATKTIKANVFLCEPGVITYKPQLHQ